MTDLFEATSVRLTATPFRQYKKKMSIFRMFSSRSCGLENEAPAIICRRTWRMKTTVFPNVVVLCSWKIGSCQSDNLPIVGWSIRRWKPLKSNWSDGKPKFNMKPPDKISRGRFTLLIERMTARNENGRVLTKEGNESQNSDQIIPTMLLKRKSLFS